MRREISFGKCCKPTAYVAKFLVHIYTSDSLVACNKYDFLIKIIRKKIIEQKYKKPVQRKDQIGGIPSII
jgi:hypothetical protein